MKVDIGPFPKDLIPVSYWSQRYDRWRTNEPLPEELPDEWYDRLVFKFFKGLQKLVAPINRWSNTRPRKVVVKYDKYDTWGLDETLAHIILPGLKQLYATNHGYFFVDAEDCNLQDKEGHDAYKWVMEELIWTFEQILDPKHFSSGNWDTYRVPVDIDGTENTDGKYSQMKKGPNHTYCIDFEAEKAYNERISNGLRLFGKYYRNLWD